MTIDYSMVYDKLSQEVAKMIPKKSFVWSHEFIENNEIHLRMFISGTHVAVDFDEARFHYDYESFMRRKICGDRSGTIRIAIREVTGDHKILRYESFVKIKRMSEKKYIKTIEDLIRGIKGSVFVEN